MFLKIFTLFVLITGIKGSESDYTFDDQAEGWLKLYKTPTSWNDAKIRCETEEAVIASPVIEKLRNAISNHVIRQGGVTAIYTGLHAEYSQGDFYSLEGIGLESVPVKQFPNVANDYSNSESCIVWDLTGYAYLRRTKCETKFPYVCYKRRKQATMLRPDPDVATESGLNRDPETNPDTRTNRPFPEPSTDLPQDLSQPASDPNPQQGTIPLTVVNSYVTDIVQIIPENYSGHQQTNQGSQQNLTDIVQNIPDNYSGHQQTNQGSQQNLTDIVQNIPDNYSGHQQTNQGSRQNLTDIVQNIPDNYSGHQQTNQGSQQNLTDIVQNIPDNYSGHQQTNQGSQQNVPGIVQNIPENYSGHLQTNQGSQQNVTDVVQNIPDNYSGHQQTNQGSQQNVPGIVQSIPDNYSGHQLTNQGSHQSPISGYLNPRPHITQTFSQTGPEQKPLCSFDSINNLIVVNNKDISTIMSYLAGKPSVTVLFADSVYMSQNGSTWQVDIANPTQHTNNKPSVPTAPELGPQPSGNNQGNHQPTGSQGSYPIDSNSNQHTGPSQGTPLLDPARNPQSQGPNQAYPTRNPQSGTSIGTYPVYSSDNQPTGTGVTHQVDPASNPSQGSNLVYPTRNPSGTSVGAYPVYSSDRNQAGGSQGYDRSRLPTPRIYQRPTQTVTNQEPTDTRSNTGAQSTSTQDNHGYYSPDSLSNPDVTSRVSFSPNSPPTPPVQDLPNPSRNPTPTGYSNFIRNAGGRFKLHQMPESFSAASTRCASEGAVLVSPLTVDLKNAITNFVLRNYGQITAFYTGIRANFSNGDYFSAEGVPVTQMPVSLDPGSPSNYQGSDSCITMSTNDNIVTSVKCTDRYPYVCYKQSKLLRGCGVQDPAYKYESTSESCYKFHNVAKTWAGAYQTCANEGGYLAIINSKKESDTLKKIFSRYPSNKMKGQLKNGVYIGIRDWQDGNSWITVKGESLQSIGYTGWSASVPTTVRNHNCGTLARNGLLFNDPCTYNLAFICEKDPETLYEDDKD